MQRHDPNLVALGVVAEKLSDLRDAVVFLGGAIVGLLVTDEAAPDLRVTTDVDFVIEIASKLEFLKFERALQKRGFRADSDPEAPRCRYVIGDLKVDVMPTDASILGFASRWAAKGIKHAEERALDRGLVIKHLSAPYFIATKLEAFNGRGNNDLLLSHDIEDIVAVVDGRSSIVDDVERLNSRALKAFLSSEITSWGSKLADAVQAHLPPDASSHGREAIVMDRIAALVATAK